MLASKLTIINLRYTGTFRKVTVLNSWIFVKVGRQLLQCMSDTIEYLTYKKFLIRSATVSLTPSQFSRCSLPEVPRSILIRSPIHQVEDNRPNRISSESSGHVNLESVAVRDVLYA